MGIDRMALAEYLQRSQNESLRNSALATGGRPEIDPRARINLGFVGDVMAMGRKTLNISPDVRLFFES